MPTYQELKDLRDRCDWIWTQMNGVHGYVVRGRSAYASNIIFLPVAGFGRGPSLSNAGLNGCYWSSVPYSDDDYAWGLYFNLDSHYTYYIYRDYGQSVRPVQGFT